MTKNGEYGNAALAPWGRQLVGIVWEPAALGAVRSSWRDTWTC